MSIFKSKYEKLQELKDRLGVDDYHFKAKTIQAYMRGRITREQGIELIGNSLKFSMYVMAA